MQNNTAANIEKAKKGFEESFESETFYNKQTQDNNHLELILNHLNINSEMKILDLGTGTGYLAFPIAEKYPLVSVLGLDVVENALEKNRIRAENDGLKNLEFVTYDGLKFPFSDEFFDMVVTRYALHHFPAIHDTFREINRVLKSDGKLFISDPAPNDDDTSRFIDAYMQMKADGHVKFYTGDEWKTIGAEAGLRIIDGFETKIRFPKKKQTALAFDRIINTFDESVIQGYAVELVDDEIWITERVNNLLFQKHS